MADFVKRRRRRQYVLDRLPFDLRIFRDRMNPLEYLNEEEVRDRYRFYPATIYFICGLVEEVGGETQRSSPLTVMLVTLVALQTRATNGHHIVTATLHGVSRSSVSRAVHDFVLAVCRHLRRFVSMPTDPEQIHRNQRIFYAIDGFPNVIGAIDCTHVRIQAPKQNEEEFVNRKGFHSINVQMICDPNFKSMDIVAKWPGSVHDARIFRESDTCDRFEIGEMDGILLGDSGYPCKKYLLTPFLAPASPAQERYNRAHCKIRVLIEQTFGIIKRRFPCLSYGLRMAPERALKVIGACGILHNIGMERNDTFQRMGEDTQAPPDNIYEGPGTGNHYRDFIATSFFS